jgi:uncharacterized protein
MMRKIAPLLIALFAATTLVAPASAAVDPMALPKLTQYVEDFAGKLTPEELAALRSTAESYKASSGHQAVAVVFPDRGGKELFDIATKIFKDNGIGDAARNDGILLVIAADEKKIRIMTGYGMEGDVPDVLAGDIIEKDVRPAVNAGKIAEAVAGFYRRLGAVAAGTDTGPRTCNFEINGECSDKAPWWMGLFMGAFAWGSVLLWRSKMVPYGRPDSDGKKPWFMALLFSGMTGLFTALTSYNNATILGMVVTAFVLGTFLPKGPIILRQSKGGDSGFGGGWGSSSGGGGGGFSGGGGSSGGGGAGD